MIVTRLQKCEAGEKQQWSTFLLFSESVFPGRVTKLQSFGQFEEKDTKIEKGNGIPLIPAVNTLLQNTQFSKTTTQRCTRQQNI